MKNKLWWTFKKGQYKARCNKIVESLTVHRNLSEYPKINKLFTTIFLIVINLYILIPLYNEVINTFDIVYEPIIIEKSYENFQMVGIVVGVYRSMERKVG